MVLDFTDMKEMDLKEIIQWLRAKLVDINRDKRMLEYAIKHLERLTE